MKQILIACVMVLTAGAAQAQSALRISLADRSPITVSVDGRYFSKVGQSVTVGDLPQGRHKVQIYALTQTRRGEREDVVYEGYVKTYEGQKTVLVYDEQTTGSDIQTMDINATAPAQPMQTAPDNQGYANGNNGQGYSQPQGGYNNNQPQGGYDNSQPQQNNDNNYVPDNNNNGQPAASPVTDQTTTQGKARMAKLKKKVMAKATDTEKFAAVKESLKQEMIICDQVAEIMDWFSFESTKVDFAEWAYDRTSDKENFSIVEDKLTYKNYRDDLEKFLQSKK